MALIYQPWKRINNNISNSLINGITLIQFNYFTNINISDCDLNMNDGNYLFNIILTGNIVFNHCNIYNNYINNIIINIIQSNITGNFIFQMQILSIIQI